MQNFARRARQTLIGDKAFYKAVLAIIIPVIIQNGISNFVNLLDNLMVGALGNEEMSGVAIANQMVMVVNICIFGGMSGPGIFCAQFFGAVLEFVGLAPADGERGTQPREQEGNRLADATAGARHQHHFAGEKVVAIDRRECGQGLVARAELGVLRVSRIHVFTLK